MAITVETPSPVRPMHLQLFLSQFSVGLVIGFTEIARAISLAVLIFSGMLISELPRGITIGLVTATVTILCTAFFSSTAKMTPSVQDNPAVLMAIGAATLAGTISSGPEMIASVVVFIFLATVLTGIFMWGLGTFDMGRLVRYIPYPVVGGFMAGTGWLLTVGGLTTMVDFDFSVATLVGVFAPAQLILWMPGVLFGLVLWMGIRRIHHYMVLPGLLLAGLIVFFAVLALAGISMDEATSLGLLLGDVAMSSSASILPFESLFQADWGAVLAQAATLATILALTATSALLNISALELTLREDIDLRREMRSMGVANVLSGLAGGMIGYQSLSMTTLRHSTGVPGRMPGIVAGALCLVFLLVGVSILAYTPRAMLGGLLLFLGLDFLYRWVIAARHKLGYMDHAVVLIILVIIALAGFLVGVAVGLVLMVLSFVVNYSRANIFHTVLSGTESASHVTRSANHQRALNKLGSHLCVMELRGFLFFGTANAIVERVRQRLNDPDQASLSFLIIDFRRVTGLDSSAALSLMKVRYLAEVSNFVVIFTHLTPGDRDMLLRNDLYEDGTLRFFPDLDHGLEFAEDALLDRDQVTRKHVPLQLQLQLADVGFSKEHTARLKPYLEVVTLNPGEYLIHQGEEATDLYFIEIGRVSVVLEMRDGRQVRIQTFTMGTIVGELGFHLKVPRSASVIADLNTRAYRLTVEALEKMKAEDPDLVIAFNELMLRLVSERLITNNQEIAALNR